MCKDTKVVNFYFSMISYQPVIPYLTQMTQIRILLIRILIRYCFDFSLARSVHQVQYISSSVLPTSNQCSLRELKLKLSIQSVMAKVERFKMNFDIKIRKVL